MTPKISIITPTFNSENTLDGTINALLRQSFNDFEYIIIDGASKDKTVDKIKSFVSAFEKKGVKVTIISEPDKGVYDAMNKGIQLAQGQLIGITNSDDWYEDCALEVMWNKFTDGSVNQGRCMLYGIERQWKDDKIYMVHRRGEAYISEGVLPHATFFVSREVYKQHGAFDLSIPVLADYDFYSRCLRDGATLDGIDVVISNFRLGGISSSFFAFYEDFHNIQLKYGYITQKHYKELMFGLKVKKMLNKVLKRW